MQKQEEKYEKLVERAEELKEQKEALEHESDQREESPNILSNRSFVTGLTKGEIVDLEYSEGSRFGRSSRVILEVSLSSGDTVRVSVSDDGEYSEENELVRLLEWKGIPEGRIDDLIGEKVKLKASEKYPRKKREYEEIDWEVYVPRRMDFFGTKYFRFDSLMRRLGLQRVDDFLADSDSIEKTFLSTIYACMLAIAATIWLFVLVPVAAVSGLAYLLTVVVATLFTPAICNYAREVWERYKDYRSKDAIA